MSRLPVIFCAVALLVGGCMAQQPIETSFDDAMAAQAKARLAPGTGRSKAAPSCASRTGISSPPAASGSPHPGHALRAGAFRQAVRRKTL